MSGSVRPYCEVGLRVDDVSSNTQALSAISPTLDSAANAAKIWVLKTKWPTRI